MHEFNEMLSLEYKLSFTFSSSYLYIIDLIGTEIKDSCIPRLFSMLFYIVLVSSLIMMPLLNDEVVQTGDSDNDV